MNRGTAVALLFLASILEAGGDALIRAALHRSGSSVRGVFFALGACVLFVYGYVVNAPAWDFGRLLGLYVVFFFITAQLIAWFAFGQPPGRPVLLGGILIVSGGLVVALLQQ